VELTKLDPGTVVVVVVVVVEDVVEETDVLEDPSASDDAQLGTVKICTLECGVTFCVLCHTPSQSVRIAKTRIAYVAPAPNQLFSVIAVPRTVIIV
jgi:hypothetical protein